MFEYANTHHQTNSIVILGPVEGRQATETINQSAETSRTKTNRATLPTNTRSLGCRSRREGTLASLSQQILQLFNVINDVIRSGSIIRVLFTPHTNPCRLHPNSVCTDDVGVRIIANKQNLFCLDIGNI